jgi:hypothetical protein
MCLCTGHRVFTVKDSILMYQMDNECSSLIGLAKLCGVFDIDSVTVESVNQTTLLMYLVIQSANTFETIASNIHQVTAPCDDCTPG